MDIDIQDKRYYRTKIIPKINTESEWKDISKKYLNLILTM